MRLARLATPIALLTLFVAGCGGGSKVVVQDVPNSTAHLTVKGGEALAPKATATPTPTVSPTTTPDTGTSGTTQTQPQSQPQAQSTPQNQAPAQSTPQGTAGGGAAAPSATPQPGSDAQQFETFCQQNPGAC